jgi:hypothetical protein
MIRGERSAAADQLAGSFSGRVPSHRRVPSPCSIPLPFRWERSGEGAFFSALLADRPMPVGQLLWWVNYLLKQRNYALNKVKEGGVAVWRTVFSDWHGSSRSNRAAGYIIALPPHPNEDCNGR